MEFSEKRPSLTEIGQPGELSKERFLKLTFPVSKKQALQKLGKIDRISLVYDLYQHSHQGRVVTGAVEDYNTKLVNKLNIKDQDILRLIVSKEKPRNFEEEEFVKINNLWSSTKFLAIKALYLTNCPPEVYAKFNFHKEGGHLQGEEFDKAMETIQEWGRTSTTKDIYKPLPISEIAPQVIKVHECVTDLVDFYNLKKPVKDIFRINPEEWKKYDPEELRNEMERLILISNYTQLLGNEKQLLLYANRVGYSKTNQIFEYLYPQNA